MHACGTEHLPVGSRVSQFYERTDNRRFSANDGPASLFIRKHRVSHDRHTSPRCGDIVPLQRSNIPRHEDAEICLRSHKFAKGPHSTAMEASDNDVSDGRPCAQSRERDRVTSATLTIKQLACRRIDVIRRTHGFAARDASGHAGS